MLKTALDAVVVMRTDGTIVGWNDVAERTFGWSFAEAQGQRMSAMIIPHRYREAHEAGLAHYLATGEGPVLDTRLEIQALRRDGQEVPVELSITRTDQFDEPVFLGFLRDISERHDAARRQELLLGELNHRAKNLLAVVSGIAHLTARSAASLDSFMPAFAGRLASLGTAHEILIAGAWQSGSLTALCRELLGPYALGGEPQVTVSGPDISLAPRQLLALSMVLHELLTNAIKYGALATPAGHVALEWTVDEGRLSLSWTESGAHKVAPPARTGFGSKMIGLQIGHELRGESTQEWTPEGLAFATEFALELPDS
ncbi:MAG: HWE histidine kinase domain-containing protein [Croceibacterium sp.]